MGENKIAIFEGMQIRKILDHGEWWFSIIDIIQILTDSDRPRKYWSDLKSRAIKEGYSELSAKIGQLKMISPDGKKYFTDCASTETILRIVQTIPSPKAEPLKRWLAKVGYERVQEIENPELSQDRMKKLYEQKGYSKDWVDKRLRGIAIRQNLTDEWKERGVHSTQDYAILTAEISKATFGVTPSEYKKIKGLKRENLRDHMTDLELIFTMLGERVATEISAQEKPKTFIQNKIVASRGGKVAGTARTQAEKELDHPVVSKSNYLKAPEKQNML